MATRRVVACVYVSGLLPSYASIASLGVRVK
jgi:hypothetical protein